MHCKDTNLKAIHNAERLFDELVDAYIEDVNERTEMDGEPRNITRKDLDIEQHYEDGLTVYYAVFTDPETDTVGEIEIVRV